MKSVSRPLSACSLGSPVGNCHECGLGSSQGPSPLKEMPGTHCMFAHVQNFLYIFRNKLCALVCMQKIILTKNTKLFFEMTPVAT